MGLPLLYLGLPQKIPCLHVGHFFQQLSVACPCQWQGSRQWQLRKGGPYCRVHGCAPQRYTECCPSCFVSPNFGCRKDKGIRWAPVRLHDIHNLIKLSFKFWIIL